jgi:pilus assembly protein CpaE
MRRELHRRVALVDGRLQFGDHRIFMDLGLDRKTILDVVTAPTIDLDLLQSVLVRHESGVDLLLSPPSPESADHVRLDDMPNILALLRSVYDYTLIDVETRLDDMTLHVLDAADVVLVVMTPDLPSLKDVRLLLETTVNLGWPSDKIKLVLNRAGAATGINLHGVESALERPIEYLIVNEYRTAISAVNTGAPFISTKPNAPLSRSIVDMARGIDAQRESHRSGQVPATSAGRSALVRGAADSGGAKRPVTGPARPPTA